MKKGQIANKRKVTAIFISKKEIRDHLGLSSCGVLDRWIAAGTFPPPHSEPGPRHSVWLRAHWDVYVRTKRWPEEAFPVHLR